MIRDLKAIKVREAFQETRVSLVSAVFPGQLVVVQALVMVLKVLKGLQDSRDLKEIGENKESVASED
ncbi:hypothetical protein BOW52_09900 [Solemya elarraichensis gill symbiont]|uniref:Uncharacterized protein n=1 Tax=Solemya elarraichensis gill symbiont TaxID=1918949 RepID=A0A1T2KYK2_9GAMM|nr:hypothetical protein BOW52_09900 [Solemya elarraichensis gill symbiont]